MVVVNVWDDCADLCPIAKQFWGANVGDGQQIYATGDQEPEVESTAG